MSPVSVFRIFAVLSLPAVSSEQPSAEKRACRTLLPPHCRSTSPVFVSQSFTPLSKEVVANLSRSKQF